MGEKIEARRAEVLQAAHGLAVIYLLDAMRLFFGKSPDEVQEVAFEINLQGQ